MTTISAFSNFFGDSPKVLGDSPNIFVGLYKKENVKINGESLRTLGPNFSPWFQF